MTDDIEGLERRIDQLRAEIRHAAVAGDRGRARSLRATLRQAEHAWEEALADIDEASAGSPEPSVPARSRRSGGNAPDSRTGSQANAAGPTGFTIASLPAREQVHQALTVLSVPAAPKLIVAVHEAFHAGPLVSARLTSLRRDEERSYRLAPNSRPYYLCAALTADLLAPARGLLAISTWPLRRRIIGPLSPRVDFLTAAVRIAQHLQRLPAPSLTARRLLWRFAANIPGAANSMRSMEPAVVIGAAETELAVHEEADGGHRESGAFRARELDPAEQLFGSRLRALGQTGTET